MATEMAVEGLAARLLAALFGALALFPRAVCPSRLLGELSDDPLSSPSGRDHRDAAFKKLGFQFPLTLFGEDHAGNVLQFKLEVASDPLLALPSEVVSLVHGVQVGD